MVRCPKCGFEQPPDQYCAKCGIDRDLFLKSQPRWSITKLLTASGFYIFLCSMFLLATSVFLYHGSEVLPTPTLTKTSQVQAQTWSRSLASVNRKAPQTADADQTPQNTSETVSESDRQESSVSADIVESEKAPLSPPTSHFTASKSTDPQTEDIPGFRATYLEVPKEVARSLLSASIDSTSGQLQRPELFETLKLRWTEAIQNYPDLVFESENVRIDRFQSATLQHRLIDSETSLSAGFTVQLKFSRDKNRSLIVSVRIAAEVPTHQLGQWSSNRRTTEKQFPVIPGSIIYVRGFIPRPGDDSPQFTLGNPLLRIFNSPLFTAQPPQSDLYLFLETTSP